MWSVKLRGIYESYYVHTIRDILKRILFKIMIILRTTREKKYLIVVHSIFFVLFLFFVDVFYACLLVDVVNVK